MKVEGPAQHVMIFVNSTDQWQGKPLYAAVVQLCHQLGVAGATVTRGDEGYGAGQHLHTSRLLELSENLPVRIDVVDVPERIAPLLTALDEIIAEGLVVIHDVHVRRYLVTPKK